MEIKVKRKIEADERTLWDVFSANIKKHRARRALSQSALAEK